MKKGVLKKHLYQSLLFNKVAGLQEHLFYRTSPGDCFCINIIYKNALAVKIKIEKLRMGRNYRNTDKMDMKILKFALSFPSVIRLIGKHKMPELRFKLRTDTGRNVSEKAFFSLRGLSYENSSPVAFPLN